MKKILLGIITLLGSTSLNAQFAYDYLKAADDYFKKGDYYSASVYYEKYIAQGKLKMKKDEYDPYAVQSLSKQGKAAVSNHQQAVYNLAESYRKLHYHEKAEPFYKEATGFDKGSFPLAGYWYGSTLKALEKYADAEQAYTAFVAEGKAEEKYIKSAQREIQSLQYIQQQLKKKELKYYTVIKAPQALNSEGASYAPVWAGNEVLLFTSTRPDSLAAASKNKQYLNRIYQANYTAGNLDSVTKVGIAQANGEHQGVVALTPDGNTMFLTRWKITGTQRTSALYRSTKVNGAWTDPFLLDTVVNKPGVNAQEPMVTPDGKYLIYSSDRKDGYGGFDLWYAELDNLNLPVNPKNMGNVINTDFDERAPYYHVPSSSLIFSSNGRVGMGGFDFYRSVGYIGNWSAPENLGYPTNSVKDDIYIASRGTERNILKDVYLSSDRSSPCCLELFYLKKNIPAKNYSGKVVNAEDGKPLGNVKVTITDEKNRTLGTQQTDSNGNYSIVLEDFQKFKAEGSLEGFFTNSVLSVMPENEDAEEIDIPVLKLASMSKPPVDVPIALNNILYDFNKAKLRKESYPMLDTIVAIMNRYPTMAIQLSSHADSKGSDKYNLKLSDKRAKSCVDYLVKKGIDRTRIEAKGYGESMPVAPNENEDGSDNPLGRQKNRRTEFKVLHY
jgi:outer membrane protein OmpA-like peptidoglycan-associated protein/tetratricopeptide (TPR) repeat protein